MVREGRSQPNMMNRPGYPRFVSAIKPSRDTELAVQELHFVYPGIVAATPHAETIFPVFPLITNHVH